MGGCSPSWGSCLERVQFRTRERCCLMDFFFFVCFVLLGMGSAVPSTPPYNNKKKNALSQEDDSRPRPSPSSSLPPIPWSLVGCSYPFFPVWLRFLFSFFGVIRGKKMHFTRNSLLLENAGHFLRGNDFFSRAM